MSGSAVGSDVNDCGFSSALACSFFFFSAFSRACEAKNAVLRHLSIKASWLGGIGGGRGGATSGMLARRIAASARRSGERADVEVEVEVAVDVDVVVVVVVKSWSCLRRIPRNSSQLHHFLFFVFFCF